MSSSASQPPAQASPSSITIPDSVVTDPSSLQDHQGIPKAIFFHDIPQVAKQYSAPALIDKLSALSQKYRYFEERLQKGKQTLDEKIAEVTRAIAAVTALSDRAAQAGDNGKPIITHFELSDGLYARATIPPTPTVCLWLGANVMVEYPHDDALQLLNNNLASAKKSFSDTCSDINFLRDQLNTTDVNLSRVYNLHVQAVRTSSPKSQLPQPVSTN